MMKTATILIAALAAFLFSTAPAPAALAKGDDLKLIAFMPHTKGVGKAKAIYEEREKKGKIEQRLKVEIEKAKPGTVFVIAVNGRTIGTVKANSLGRGQVHFKSITDNPGGPTKLPFIEPGDRVTVGRLSGTFSIKS